MKKLIYGFIFGILAVLLIFIFYPFGKFPDQRGKIVVDATENKKIIMPEEKNKVKDYYSQWGREADRLFKKPPGIIERLRTESILKRSAPKSPAVVYDVGGGAGVYAFPLTEQGYSVHLIDFTPLHIEQAKERMKETGIKLAECSVGDARKLKVPDVVADIVLYFGPLYHLLEKKDRAKALREAYRILKPGGMFFAAGISHFAALLDFGFKNKLGKPSVAPMIEEGLKTGKHNIPVGGRGIFSAYFHHPDELEKEVQEVGFKEVKLFSIECPSWMFTSLQEIVDNKQSLDKLLYFLEMIETDRSIIGASSHIMAIGKK